MNPAARNAYVDQMVTTAGPGRLLVMLFDRLVLDVQRALEFQQNEDFAAASTQVRHAQEIVLERRASLQRDVWEGAARLDSIYAWLHSHLIRANVQRDPAVTAECLRIIEPLAETWREAALVTMAG